MIICRNSTSLYFSHAMSVFHLIVPTDFHRRETGSHYHFLVPLKHAEHQECDFLFPDNAFWK